MKRKFFKLITGICILFGILFTSCQDSPDDDGGSPSGQQTTLKQRIASATDDATIDVGAENLLITNGDSYTVSKKLTIKNGNIKGATFIVESDGVTLENLTGVSSITVDEKVGNGNFKLTNCYDIDTVYVNGGGANSIHISNTTVKKMVVQKNGVRINLEDSSTKIEKAFIFNTCKLDADDVSATFGSVFITETVEKLELAGKAMIERLVSAAETTSVKITVETTVTITAADSTVKELIKDEYKKTISDVTLSEEEKAEIEAAQALAKLNFYAAAKGESTAPKNQYSFLYDGTEPNTYVDNISGVSIAKTAEEVVITNENAASIEKMWSYWLMSGFYIKAKQGKNYKISFDMKADKESYISFQVKDNFRHPMSGSSVLCKVGTDYQMFSVMTGTAFEDWKYGLIWMGTGSVSKLYIKNYKIEEVDETTNITLNYWVNDSKSSYENLSGTVKGDVAKISLKGGSGNKNFGIDVAVNNILLDIGKIYKFSFDVTSDVDIKPGEIGIWVHGYDNSKDTAGSSLFSFTANETKKITVYVPVYTDGSPMSADAYSPNIPFVCNSSKGYNLTVENFEAEEITLDKIREENPDLDLHFAAWVNDDWHVYSKDETILVNAHFEGDGQVILSDLQGWSSTENPVTSFKVLGKNNTALKAEVDERYVERDKMIDNRLFFSNDTDEPIFIKFGLDDKYQMVLEKSSADEYVGFYDNTAYLGVDSEDSVNWTQFDLPNGRNDLVRGKWYEATYIIESAEKRNKNYDDEYAEIITAKWHEDKTLEYGGIYTEIKKTRVPLSSKQQTIKQVFYLDDNPYTWVYSQVNGHNAIVKFSAQSCNSDSWIAETTKPELADCWYYYDIDKSELGGTEIVNIIFNNGTGIQAESINLNTTEPSYWYDFWKEDIDEEGHYLISISERTDNPPEQPEAGFIRIYFYSELMESETPYLHYWVIETESVPAFGTDWPGVPMIKYEQ